MRFLRTTWDGLLSIVAAALTAAITFLPAWYAHMSIDAGRAPIWLYANIAGLVGIGGLMVLAFLRKAKDGVSPLRDRRRK